MHFLSYLLLSALVAYIDYRALSFTHTIQTNRPNLAHEINLLALCAVVVCAASIALYSLARRLQPREPSYLAVGFDLAIGALMVASLVAITTAMTSLGVRFFR